MTKSIKERLARRLYEDNYEAARFVPYDSLNDVGKGELATKVDALLDELRDLTVDEIRELRRVTGLVHAETFWELSIDAIKEGES